MQQQNELTSRVRSAFILTAAALMALPLSVGAQALDGPLELSAEADRLRLMGLLGIGSLPPGAGGTKLHRRRFGEVIENVLAPNEYHWMAGNYFKYGGNWDALPVDAHSLIALVAPRPLFISAGNDGDLWVDPKGSFLAAAHASPVYELVGARGLSTAEFPPLDTPLIDGDIGFHQHEGGHTAAPTWPTFIEFARRYLNSN